MSKPNIVLCKPKSAVCKVAVNFFCTICKPINLSNSEMFCKILLIRGLFLHAYYVQHISGSIRQSHFLGSKKVYSVYHSFHGFASRCWSESESVKQQVAIPDAFLPVYLSLFEGGMIIILEKIVASLAIKCAPMLQASSAKKGTARTSVRKGTPE